MTLTNCVVCNIDPTRTQLKQQRLVRGLCGTCYARCKYRGTLGEVGLPVASRARTALGTRQRGIGGYIYLHTPLGRQLEHRVLMEDHLGRELVEGETVSHRNGLKHDNRLENLELRVRSPRGHTIPALFDYLQEQHTREWELRVLQASLGSSSSAFLSAS